MKSNAWVVFNRLSVSEEDVLAITVPYVTRSYSLFYIMCLQSVISYSYISHFMIIKLQIQKKMWIHKIIPIWTCSSNKLFWQDVLIFLQLFSENALLTLAYTRIAFSHDERKSMLSLLIAWKSNKLLC